MDSCDVLVIGGGAAGTAAAFAASAAGARVCLVRRSPGATALSRGGWYTAPPRAFRDALALAGLDLIECAGALPHPDGHLVQCEVAPASHAHAAIVRDSASIQRTIVIGIDGLPSFHPRALAALWTDAAGLPPDALRYASVTLENTPPAGWSPVALAALLDREPDRLGRALAEVTRPGDIDRVIVPAVLGLDDPIRVQRAVAEAAGVPVAEALGSTPSIPGWRLDQTLRVVLTGANVRVLTGSATGAKRNNNQIEHVTIHGDDGDVAIEARAYVLATGKYLGGGIAGMGPAFTLSPFAITIDDPGAPLMVTDPVRTEPQPVLSSGVRVDADGRPVGPNGDMFASNIFATGSVKAGVETATLGLGAAAHDGWTGGEHAAAFASSAGS